MPSSIQLYLQSAHLKYSYIFIQKMKAVADAAKDAANESKKQLEFSEDERRKLEKSLNAAREELDTT